MQLKEFDILLDIKKQRKTEKFEAVQGDNKTNVLNITLTNSEQEYPLINNDIEVAFKRADGKVIIQEDVTILNNRIKCMLDTSTIAVPGKVIAEIRIINTNFLLTSTQFEFNVRQSIR